MTEHNELVVVQYSTKSHMLHPKTTKQFAVKAIIIIIASAASYAGRNATSIAEHHLGALSSTGTYVLAYHFLWYAYERWFWKLFHRECWIDGYWKMTNHHKDNSVSKGIFRLIQRAETVELRNGMNTEMANDGCVSEFWSTSGNLIVRPESSPDDIVFDYSYCVRRFKGSILDKTDTYAHERLRVRAPSSAFFPDKLEGAFDSGINYNPAEVNRSIGYSECVRVSKKEYKEFQKKHEQMRKQLTRPPEAEQMNC